MAISRRAFIRNMCISGGSVFAGACSNGAAPRAMPSDWTPAYARLEDEGLLADRVEQAYAYFSRCRLCPRQCRADRTTGDLGFCGASSKVTVFSHHAHYGEELPLVGRGGSGTIFFSHCNLRCVFCQNWPIAHEGRGREVTDDQLADMMIDLQRRGCHNINVVTPTHVMPNILNATRKALHKGLQLPICYNTGGYERVEMIRLLDGVVDIYLPDLKYMDGAEADRYTVRGADDYPEMAQNAIKEMHRQVGDLIVDDRGLALRGLMVRHLVMPNRIAGTREFVRWVADNLSKDTYVNIMAQYRVEHMAFNYPRIARAITREEYLEAMQWAEEAGLRNLDKRSLAQRDVFLRRAG